MASRQSLERVAVLSIAILWVLWMSRPFLLTGPLSYVRANELGDAVYPQVAYVVRLLRDGQISLWLPSQAGGTDLLGNFNAPFLNVLLYAALPGWLGNGLIFLVVVGAASVSTYVLLRRDFDCDAWAACLGVVAYTTWFLFAGMVFAYAAGLSYALAPLVLHVLLSTRRWSVTGLVWSAALGLAFACSGHFSWSIFALGTVFFCALLLAPSRIVLWLPQLAIICLITVLVQLPFLLANMQTAPFSARAYYGPYYYIKGYESMLVSYILTNPTPAPYFRVLGLASAVAAVAVLIASPRLPMLKQAWPVWGLSALFVLLPVIDIAGIYVLSVLRINGYHVDPDGGFGGPMDLRLRHGRIFIACIAIAVAADRFWKATGLRGIVTMPVSLKYKWHPHMLIVSFAPIQGLIRRLRRDIASIRWRRSVLLVRFPNALSIGRTVVVAAVLVFGVVVMAAWLSRVRQDLREKRQLAFDGVNFSSFYAHPELRALAAANPDFDTYRVATVQLYGPDSEFNGPPRDPSLFGPFLNAYGFQAADAYMSNLTQRSMNYWNWMLTGAPDYGADGRHPRARFADDYERKFVHPEQAFSQKLYLFEPLHSKTLDPDGCIRTQTPIDFSKYYNLDMLSLFNVTFIVSGIPLTDPRLTLLESSTRDELRALQCAPPHVRRRAFRDRGLTGRPLYIYRNRDVVPRVFAPRSIEVVDGQDAMLEALTRRSTERLAGTALVVRSEALPPVAAGPKGLDTGIAGVETVRGDHIKISTRSKTGGIVVMSSSFSPHWRASANGRALAVFPAYHTFIGIWVPAGDHQVDLRYRPPYARLLGYDMSE